MSRKAVASSLRIAQSAGRNRPLAQRSYASAAQLISDEPSTSKVTTQHVPGSKSKAASAAIDLIQDSRTHQLVVDYTRSKGNFLVDADGNTLLDVFAQISSITLGYNVPAMLELGNDPEFITAALNRPALGAFPPVKWAEILETGLMTVAPKGLDQCTTTLCGSSANENAFKLAFMAYKARERGHTEFTSQELDSSMWNQSPGSPELSILSFTSGFHGRLFGSLSATRSKAIHKVDIPAFNWPAAHFPQVKYPLEAHQEYNAQEEKRCLEEYERILTESKTTRPVAGVIVEPVLSEGGDKHASNDFFRSLRRIAKKHGAAFIVDEVQTGVGATGKMWAHEHWELPVGEEPDFVTFSKKMQASGIYHKKEMRPNTAYRIYGTWMGDPMRALQARKMLQIIKEHDLVSHTASIGKTLAGELRQIVGSSSAAENLRGDTKGTFMSFDFETPALRDQFATAMRKNGVLMGACGDRSVRLRPMLTFGEKHVHILTSAIKKSLQDLS